MLSKDQIINKLKQSKKVLKDSFSINKVGLFGSYSNNTYSTESDIDIIYHLETGKRMGLKDVYELELFFKDLFQIDKIDLVNSKYVNPIINSEIEKSVIYV